MVLFTHPAYRKRLAMIQSSFFAHVIHKYIKYLISFQVRHSLSFSSVLVSTNSSGKNSHNRFNSISLHSLQVPNWICWMSDAERSSEDLLTFDVRWDLWERARAQWSLVTVLSSFSYCYYHSCTLIYRPVSAQPDLPVTIFSIESLTSGI